MSQSADLARYILRDERQTARLGAALWPLLRAGDCLLLSGPLGAGKTCFARGLIRAACGDETDVPSPSFALLQSYECEPPVRHFDLYRLARPDDIWELGFEDCRDDISLIEWPEKAAGLMPEDALMVMFSVPKKDAKDDRQISFKMQEKNHRALWSSRLESLTHYRTYSEAHSPTHIMSKKI